MNTKRFIWWFVLFMVLLPAGCNIDDTVSTVVPPTIEIDSESGIYTVKVGRELVISPSYSPESEMTYRWTMDGKLLGEDPDLHFLGQETGEYFITITARNDGGTASEELKVEVVDLEIPNVSIASEKNITVSAGSTLNFNATVRQTSLETAVCWTINGEQKGDGNRLTFSADELGKYVVEVTAKNDDGESSDKVEVEVIDPADLPFVWEFDKTDLHTVAGRKLLITPSKYSGDVQADFAWKKEGEEEVSGTDYRYAFIAAKPGTYRVSAVATVKKDGDVIFQNKEFEITVYEADKFRRDKTAASSADLNKVYEYTPAPGQFIGGNQAGMSFDYKLLTPEDAVQFAFERMTLEQNVWVSLGGFGGYLVAGFDHSIENIEGYDLALVGNSFDGSSEPGIVWVMQDENGNGLPDDTWYELKGSETGKPETIQNYAVTYYRPTAPQMPVQWTDNQGNSGEIDYLIQYHPQPYYYPDWIKEDSYTLAGTCLKARNYDKSGNGTYWVQPAYDWGYVDNFSPIDHNLVLKVRDMANLFELDNAIDFEGNEVKLTHIDFVKVVSGLNAKSGWLGELSTEICGMYDYSMKKVYRD